MATAERVPEGVRNLLQSSMSWFMSVSELGCPSGKWSKGPEKPGFGDRALWVVVRGCSSASLHAHAATHLPYFASSFAQGWTKDAQGALDREDAPQSSHLCISGAHFLAHMGCSTSA